MEQTLHLNGEPIPKLSKGKLIGIFLLLLFATYISDISMPLDIVQAEITAQKTADQYLALGIETFDASDVLKGAIEGEMMVMLCTLIILIPIWILIARYSANKALGQKQCVNIICITSIVPKVLQLIVLFFIFGIQDDSSAYEVNLLEISNPYYQTYLYFFYKPLYVISLICAIVRIYAIALFINNNRYYISDMDMTWLIFLIINIPIFSLIALIKLANCGLVTSNYSGANNKINYSPINKYAIGGILYYVLTAVVSRFIEL